MIAEVVWLAAFLAGYGRALLGSMVVDFVRNRHWL
jgi:hypothetical protein